MFNYYAEDEEYDIFETNVYCHTPNCRKEGLTVTVTVYHPSDEFYCSGCGQRMW